MNNKTKKRLFTIMIVCALMLIIPINAYAASLKVVYGELKRTGYGSSNSHIITLSETCTKIFYACDGTNTNATMTYTINQLNDAYSTKVLYGRTDAVSQNQTVYLPAGTYEVFVQADSNGTYDYALNFTNE